MAGSPGGGDSPVNSLVNLFLTVLLCFLAHGSEEVVEVLETGRVRGGLR